jgi:hypothetical protein
MPQDRFYGLLRLCGLVFGLATTVAVVPQAASAAQIDITNCQAKRVTICSYDDSWGDAPNQSHLIAQGETNPFKCKANCVFWMLECVEGTCHACKGGYGHWIDHSWGKGSYQLIPLDLNKNQYQPGYSSMDLKKVDSGTACGQ